MKKCLQSIMFWVPNCYDAKLIDVTSQYHMPKLKIKKKKKKRKKEREKIEEKAKLKTPSLNSLILNIRN